jgi:hypothetical protein
MRESSFLSGPYIMSASKSLLPMSELVNDMELTECSSFYFSLPGSF